MCWQRTLRASCAEATTPCLRRLVRRSLPRPITSPELLDDVELLTSEMTANALNAHCTSIEITITVHDQWLELAVTDDAAGRPQIREPSASAGNGRGLIIIDAISAAWGVRERRGGGKSVWSRLALPAAACVRTACSRPVLPAVAH